MKDILVIGPGPEDGQKSWGQTEFTVFRLTRKKASDNVVLGKMEVDRTVRAFTRSGARRKVARAERPIIAR